MNGILHSLLIASRIVKAAAIRELAQLLPADCAFLVQKLGTRTSDAGIRVEVCLSEPRFGYFFVMHYLTTKTTLPPGVLEPILQRAYYHRRYQQPNEAIEMALALNHPGNKQRPVLNALLVCNDFSETQIAQAVGISEEAVQAYDCLFFNVRDRLEDHAYAGSLVYPNGRFERFQNNGWPNRSWETELLQVGFEYGAKEVLYMAGYLRQRPKQTLENLSNEFEHLVLNAAVTAARHGKMHVNDSAAIKNGRALAMARKKLQSPCKESGSSNSLAELGDGRAIFDTVLRLQGPHIRKRLPLSQADVKPPAA